MNPSASKLPRALPCVASEALPQVLEDGSSKYADVGRGVHAFLDTYERLGRDRDAALAEVPEDAPWRAFCEQIPVERLPSGGRREIAIAWDSETDTTRVLGEGGGRPDYRRFDLKPTEWPATLDVLGLLDGRAFDIDWKTGYRTAGVEQVLMGCLAGSRLLGTDEAAYQFWYFRPDGNMWLDPLKPMIVDELELAAFATRLREWPAQLERAREQLRQERPPTVVTGDHCVYCRAKPYCPAKVSLARSMAGEIVTLRDQLGMLAPGDRGRVYDKAHEVLDIAKLIIAQLEEVARVSPFQTPDGQWMREVEAKMPTKIKAHLAAPVLREVFGEYGDRVVASAITSEPEVTFSSIRDALRPFSTRGYLRKNERKATEALRRAGALVERTSMEVRKSKKERDE